MNTENDVLGKNVGTSSSTSPSSARSTKVTKQSSSEAKTVEFDMVKTPENTFNKLEAPERSIGGGVHSADIDQPGSAVGSARVQADRRPGELELLPGVQAPRECLTPQRQVDKVGTAGAWAVRTGRPDQAQRD